MHCLWEGVVKQFKVLWFDSKNHKQPWYIKKKFIPKINQILDDIKVPQEIKPPKHVDKKGLWKAIDYKNWCLYFSLLCLKGR
jgi:hypothetical protein